MTASRGRLLYLKARTRAFWDEVFNAHDRKVILPAIGIGSAIGLSVP